MDHSARYNDAKERYGKLGIDADKAIRTLKDIPVSLHCWQGDDVRGFDTDPNKPLTGGIQTTGNYPGRARTPEELMADLDEVLKLIPGHPTATGQTGTSWSQSTSANGWNSAKSAAWGATSTPHSSHMRNAIR